MKKVKLFGLLSAVVLGLSFADNAYVNAAVPAVTNPYTADSYINTQMHYADAVSVINKRKTNFSNLNIVCLGDSITYPYTIKKKLKAGSVKNLGVAGSAISRCSKNAMVDRYASISKSADVIVVMAGVNDYFKSKNFGNFNSYDKKSFCSGTLEMMTGLKKKYPRAKIIVVTPLRTSKSARNAVQGQGAYVDAVKLAAEANGFSIVDLYYSNILDSYDGNVVRDYIPDKLHPNANGYDILGTIVAAEIVKVMDK